jgi:hypothetical protein
VIFENFLDSLKSSFFVEPKSSFCASLFKFNVDPAYLKFKFCLSLLVNILAA